MDIAHAWGSTCIALAVVSAKVAPAARINGGSSDRFELSHAELVASLASEQQLKLSLAEIVFPESKRCLSGRAAHADSFVEQQLGWQLELTSCRKKLHSLGCQEITVRSYCSLRISDSEAVPLNNTSEPTPLRGSA
ncbi:hypothetical protein [Xanthomonas sacchari]|uniref:hypothetical protein n=1 Tax=Xanthomonas sacchari TaxID=56458 RepID=UPI00224FAD61|nr:hypothetical protein [Xanthomonas sacchari]